MTKRTLASCLVGACVLFGCEAQRIPAATAGPGASVPVAPLPAKAPPAPPPLNKIDRSGMADVGTDAPLDYGNPALWACRPDNDPNECDRDLDATEISKDGTRRLVRHARAEHPTFDCFYLYPTVKLAGGGSMTDFSDAGIALVDDPLLSQAARFSRICTVYAPLYRQAGMERSATGGASRPPPGGPARELALADARAAFKYYLDHLNHGRNFVLLGHSQGTALMTGVMQVDVDPLPDVRSRMISALLIGGGVSVANGQRTGGSFKNIPTCSAPGETGCAIAYASFAAEAPPAKDSRFGTSPIPGTEIACTEPGALAGNSGRYRGSYFRSKVTNPAFKPDLPLPEGIDTPFVRYPEIFSGQCVKRDGRTYLEISLKKDPEDKRATPPYRSATLEGMGFGLHLVDYNLALEELIAAVEKQAAAMH